MKRIRILLTIAGLLFLTAGVLAGTQLTNRQQTLTPKAAASTVLSISPSAQNVFDGNIFSFTVNMDTGNNKITGVDILLKFDPNKIQVSSIERGSGATDLSNTILNDFNNTDGTVSFAIFTLDKSLAVSGSSVNVLTVNARVKTGTPAGSSVIVFDASTAASGVNENQSTLVDAIPGNIIVQNATPSPSPTIIPTATPSPAPGQPNSCGGTCGSNLNCESNLICYQGYCRNPSCTDRSNCSCTSATTSPTNKPAATPVKTPVPTKKPAATSVPVIVSTQLPTAAPTPQEESNFWQNVYQNTPNPESIPSLEPALVDTGKTVDFLPWIIGSLVVAGLTLVLIVAGLYKNAGLHPKKPPVIKI